MYNLFSAEKVTEKAKALFKEERAKMRVDGWFLAREIVCDAQNEFKNLSKEMQAAKELEAIVTKLPLTISDNAVFAGSQSDAFARSYALINPTFKVETFSGYCDPTAVYNDIEPNEEFTVDRINRVREFSKNSSYVKALTKVYDNYENYTEEVAFFIEQVTGHIIPDFRPALKYGLAEIFKTLDKNIAETNDEYKKDNFESIKLALNCAVILANRYADIAAEKAKSADGDRKAELIHLE